MDAYLVLVYEKLSEPERAVWDAAQAGTPVELPLGAPAAADPAMGKTWAMSAKSVPSCCVGY